MNRIPFNRASFEGEELECVRLAVEGQHISGDGVFSRKCHEFLESVLGVRKALLTTSCTHALEMTALLLDIQPGDEVIVPTFTFVSTANAFALRGARLVFADIRPDTLNLDERVVERLMTGRTRAVVPVHYAGVGCEMDAILELAARRGAAVVEDNAHGLFGKYRGRFLGSLGCMAAQSFHETKNFTCGEGGALLINDSRYVLRAEIIREKGTDRSRFLRGEVDKYSWVDLGSSYLPSEILAGFLWAQLNAREKIQSKRRRIWEQYDRELASWAERHGVGLPYVPPHCEHPFHMFYLIMPTEAARGRLIAHLKQQNIMSVFHYLPLHVSTMGRRWGGREGDCPVAEDISRRLLRLPFYTALRDEDQAFVVEQVMAFTAF